MATTEPQENKIALANIANQMALSIDAVTSAKKDWFPAALALLPVIYKPELLKELGYQDGATAYFKDQSNALGLKQTTLANIKNTFQKVISFKKLFEYTDLKDANISVLTNIFNNAKAKNSKGKLTESNVRKQIEIAIEAGTLKKSDINYVEDIDNQIQFTKSLKIKQLDKTDPNIEIILDVLDEKQTAKPRANTPATKTKQVNKEDPIKETKPANESAQAPETKPENESAQAQETKPANESAQVPGTMPVNTPPAEQETKSGYEVAKLEQTTSSGSEIIDLFRDLNILDRELIANVAAAMVTDETEALLLSLPVNKQSLIVEMIKRMK